ncbi:MAG: hypothetical protein NTW69_19960 [Chloroflexi bacterium]|nr:hypothetical protein [Chloroflexota bacterium]
MNQRRFAFKLLLFVLILSLTLGCGFATSTFQAATPTPSPVIVEVSVDETNASSAVISPDGGTITAQGADGTKFTLTFPKDALSNDETITLTPITAIDGLPFSGGFVGGVQMAPEGLRLFQPAMLTIESPKTVAATGFETVAFAYHQNGDGLYLNPSEAKGNQLMIEIWHFSGAGAAQGTPAEIQSQQGRVPSNAEDAFTQRMRDYLGRERQAQLLGQPTDSDLQKTMGDFLREGYDSFIAPQLPIALQNCEAAPAILSKALGWLRQVQLLGYDEQFSAENTKIMDTMSQALANCYNKEYDQCVIDKKIAHRTTMLGMYRQASLLGMEDQLDYSKIEKCPPTKGWKVNSSLDKISGIVCDFGNPFELQLTSGWGSFPLSFTPSSPKAGTSNYTASSGNTSENDNGSYTVEGVGTQEITISIHDHGCITSTGGTACGDTDWSITLAPLDTNECSQP